MYLSLVIAATLAASPVTSSAAATPTEVLKQRDAEIRAALPAPGQELTDAQRTKLEQILVDAVDLEGMAKATVGKSWNAQPKAKQKKFVNTFLARFKSASGTQLDSYRATTIEYKPERTEGDSVIVPTLLTVKGEPTQVDYVFAKRGKKWLIEDIIVDTVSTVQNYRASFAKVISKEGFDGLIARLEKGGQEKKIEASVPASPDHKQ